MRETLPWGGHRLYDLLVGRRLRAFYLRIAGAQPDATAILDVGCGSGHLTRAIAQAHPDAQVAGVDLDPVQIRLAGSHPKIQFQVAGSRSLPFADQSMDWVVTSASFHHWRGRAQSLEEVHRILKPGGQFWIVEGSGDMTRDELANWRGKRPFPGIAAWVRLVFRVHGYTPKALQETVIPDLNESPFGGCEVERRDGWWLVKMVRSPGGITETKQIA